MIGIEISKSTNVGIEDLWITNCKIGIWNTGFPRQYNKRG